MSENKIANCVSGSDVLDQLSIGLFIVDREMRVVYWNRFMEINSGRHEEEIVGNVIFDSFPELPKKWLERKIKNVFLLNHFSFTSWEQRSHLFKFPNHRMLQGDVEDMYQDSYFYPIKGDGGEVDYVCISIFNVTDTGVYQSLLKTTIDTQNDLIAQLKEAQHQLQQSEKMAAVGQLAAGVAHEINNPVAFVASNLKSLKGYISDLVSVIDSYEAAESKLDPQGEEMLGITAAKDKIDYGFIKDDIVQLLDESDDGLLRVRNIVQDLKDFSRPDSGDWGWACLQEGIDSTLNVVNNEVKYKATVIKDYADIPDVHCIAAQLNQVFMNLIVNAAHAIEEQGEITIRTGAEGDQVWVEIEDTGKGIEDEHLKRVFDPFFTTKPVGKGTGLGLSVSYGIVEKHKGRMEVRSELGKGTCFRVWLPINPLNADDAEAPCPK